MSMQQETGPELCLHVCVCAAVMCAILLWRADWQWEAAKARGLLDSAEDEGLQDHAEHALENGNGGARHDPPGARLGLVRSSRHLVAEHASWVSRLQVATCFITQLQEFERGRCCKWWR